MKLSTHLFYLAAALFAGQVMSTPVAAAAAEAEAGDVLHHDSIQARSICHGSEYLQEHSAHVYRR